MSAQPNRKQQRLARELSKSEGISYQAALAEIRAPAQEPDGVVPPQRRMLDLLYETFAMTGQWPLFQYVSTRWDEVNVEAQDVYLDLAEQGLVRPAMTRSHEFQLRQETVVGVSLQGLMAMGSAAEDLDRFVAAVRYVANSAREFRPSSPTELGRLELTSEDVRQNLGLELGDPSLARLGALLCGRWGSSRAGGAWRPIFGLRNRVCSGSACPRGRGSRPGGGPQARASECVWRMCGDRRCGCSVFSAFLRVPTAFVGGRRGCRPRAPAPATDTA